MACTTCHDPHGEDRRARLDELATPAGNGVCTTCHGALAGDAALGRHAHHDPKGAGGSCVACHMPRKNMGLGYALTRYHRIGSPTDRARVEGDRPMECVLCHADKTVGAVLDDIARLWGRRYDEAAVVRLYGARDANVLLATIARGHAHEQATAIGIAGDAKLAPALALIEAQARTNAYPLVRLYAQAARARLLDLPLGPALEAAAAEGHPTHPGNATDADDED
jgi:predicted CXXCH cytochrome family protein